MTGYTLPTTADIGDRTYKIRSDYRAALDIIEVMNDAEIDNQSRGIITMTIFYEDFETIPKKDYQEAINYMYWFIGGGDDMDESQQKKPRLIDWQQDFPLIVSPVNRVLGYEIRAVEYLHWWTFLSAYYEIGECLFSQVVGIRQKKAKHRKLDKSDEEFYRANRKIIDIQQTYTPEEEDTISKWMV